MDLPTFEGNFEDWLRFTDQFEALIVNNGRLSGCKKFHYLKSALKGESLKIIDAISTTNDTFVTAWEFLQTKYDNQRELVFHY